MDRSSNVFKFQGSNMIVSAKGPSIDKHVNMSTSFRSNLMSSTLNIPRNFAKQNYTQSVVSQRSIYYGRETSPTASIRSDLQPRNFHQPFYQRGCSQRSLYSGRGGSPVSMRSIDSTVSIATDIVQAIKNGKFNGHECKMIKQALRKHDFWKRTEKRRKMQMYLKNLRNRSDEDSGDQCSNSSTTSDECASTRTGYSQRYDRNYKENVPRSTNSMYGQLGDAYRRDNRHTYMEYARSDTQNPYQRHTDSYDPENILPYEKEPQCDPNNFYASNKNGLSHEKSLLYSQNNLVNKKKTFSSQPCITGQSNNFSNQTNILNSSVRSTRSMQNMTMMSQKDRFKGGFQFPSQKFIKSTLFEDNEQDRPKQFPNKECFNNKKNIHTDPIDEDSDENDDIFLDTTVKSISVAKKSESAQKRKIESLGAIPVSAKKKPKTTFNNDKPRKQTQNKYKNEFEFAKPQLPIRKAVPAKSREKLISKSANAPELVFDVQEKENCHFKPVAAPSPEPSEEPEQTENTQLTTSDMSMRPSFMKRKLFTQTLDVTERKNNSSESLATDSPQSNIYSALSREKHKTRKLVTSQSLLSRDINQDDNNLLDLIHKIVPPNQVNSTITANNTKSFNSKVSGNKHNDGDDKWDITSIISTCNNDSVSETYTDDEIFKQDTEDKKNTVQEKPLSKQTKPGNKNKNSEEKSKKSEDKIKKQKGRNTENKKTDKTENRKAEDNINKINKIVPNKITLPEAPKIPTPVKADPARKVVLSSSRIDAFWNTDVESDYECVSTSPALKRTDILDPLHSHIASPNPSSTEIRPKTLSLKMTKTNKTHGMSPIVVLKNDTTLVKVLKNQTSKKINEPKTLKKSNNEATQSDKPSKSRKDIPTTVKGTPRAEKVTSTKKKRTPTIKKGTPTIALKTRRQINLLTSSERVKNLRANKKGPSPNKTLPVKTAVQKKHNNEMKATQEKNKIKPSSEIAKNRPKKPNDCQKTDNSENLEETPNSQNRAKITKVENSKNEIVCKMLRSRAVDLSSSFNSDKFELTMCRARKSRTPSKRISFSKTNNIANNKTRSRATKA